MVCETGVLVRYNLLPMHKPMVCSSGSPAAVICSVLGMTRWAMAEYTSFRSVVQKLRRESTHMHTLVSARILITIFGQAT